MDTFYCSEIMLNKFDYWSKKEIHNTGELKITNVQNGIIFPLENNPKLTSGEDYWYGGVCDQHLNFIEESLQIREQGENIPKRTPWYIGANPKYKAPYIYIYEDVIFIGVLNEHFGLFILESLSRLWYYLEQDNKNIKLAYLTSEKMHSDFYHKYDYFFTLLNIKKDQLIEIKKPTQFKSVIIPEQSLILQGSYHDKYLKTINKIMEPVVPGKYKKVFFSKKYASSRHIGRNLSDEIFSENGYQIFYPELLDVATVLSILKGCEHFAAQSGSNAHHAIFCNDINVTVLNRSEHVHISQNMISEMKNQHTTYVDTFYPPFLPIDWTFGPHTFAYTTYLENYLIDNNFKFDKKKLQEKSTQNFLLYIIKWAETYDTKRRQEFIKPRNLDSIIAYIKEFNFMPDNFINELSTFPSPKIKLPLWKKIIREILRPIKRVIKKCIKK